nr:unnamed protein product [Callosobruchus chinensis]CAH7723166.1 unnamed protein product [Callosobruchus chinensis]CAH7729448.1 unnamed protein product [Callosobruchus chinensis]CAH7730169.1 unnamed protein product [Callosobruchus chinensis]CAH7731439.1 unnamed protein product [Callosobruchus chinensis]
MSLIIVYLLENKLKLIKLLLLIY